jgi:hypothetical protein
MGTLGVGVKVMADIACTACARRELGHSKTIKERWICQGFHQQAGEKKVFGMKRMENLNE